MDDHENRTKAGGRERWYVYTKHQHAEPFKIGHSIAAPQYDILYFLHRVLVFTSFLRQFCTKNALRRFWQFCTSRGKTATKPTGCAAATMTCIIFRNTLTSNNKPCQDCQQMIQNNSCQAYASTNTKTDNETGGNPDCQALSRDPVPCDRMTTENSTPTQTTTAAPTTTPLHCQSTISISNGL